VRRYSQDDVNDLRRIGSDVHWEEYVYHFEMPEELKEQLEARALDFLRIDDNATVGCSSCEKEMKWCEGDDKIVLDLNTMQSQCSSCKRQTTSDTFVWICCKGSCVLPYWHNHMAGQTRESLATVSCTNCEGAKKIEIISKDRMRSFLLGGVDVPAPLLLNWINEAGWKLEFNSSNTRIGYTKGSYMGSPYSCTTIEVYMFSAPAKSVVAESTVASEETGTTDVEGVARRLVRIRVFEVP